MKRKKGVVGLFDQPRRKPFAALEALCGAFHLPELQAEFHNWQVLSLWNGASAFAEGKERKRLMQFCDAFHTLLAALYCLQRRHRPQQHTATQEGWSAEPMAVRETQALRHIPETVAASPDQVLADFFARYTATYADSMLLDMLEAALLYQNGKALANRDVVFCYRVLRGFVRAGKALVSRRFLKE